MKYPFPEIQTLILKFKRISTSCYANNYELAPIDGAAVQADDCGRRVYRGGGYADQAAVLRAASRRAAAPGTRQRGVGFRVVRALD
jgi:formylglycine-generating enzyme required for sulfatase activity